VWSESDAWRSTREGRVIKDEASRDDGREGEKVTGRDLMRASRQSTEKGPTGRASREKYNGNSPFEFEFKD